MVTSNSAFWEAVTLVVIVLLVLIISTAHINGWGPSWPSTTPSTLPVPANTTQSIKPSNSGVIIPPAPGALQKPPQKRTESSNGQSQAPQSDTTQAPQSDTTPQQPTQQVSTPQQSIDTPATASSQQTPETPQHRIPPVQTIPPKHFPQPDAIKPWNGTSFTSSSIELPNGHVVEVHNVVDPKHHVEYRGVSEDEGGYVTSGGLNRIVDLDSKTSPIPVWNVILPDYSELNKKLVLEAKEREGSKGFAELIKEASGKDKDGEARVDEPPPGLENLPSTDKVSVQVNLNSNDSTLEEDGALAKKPKKKPDPLVLDQVREKHKGKDVNVEVNIAQGKPEAFGEVEVTLEEGGLKKKKEMDKIKIMGTEGSGSETETMKHPAKLEDNDQNRSTVKVNIKGQESSKKKDQEKQIKEEESNGSDDDSVDMGSAGKKNTKSKKQKSKKQKNKSAGGRSDGELQSGEESEEDIQSSRKKNKRSKKKIKMRDQEEEEDNSEDDMIKDKKQKNKSRKGKKGAELQTEDESEEEAHHKRNKSSKKGKHRYYDGQPMEDEVWNSRYPQDPRQQGRQWQQPGGYGVADLGMAYPINNQQALQQQQHKLDIQVSKSDFPMRQGDVAGSLYGMYGENQPGRRQDQWLKGLEQESRQNPPKETQALSNIRREPADSVDGALGSVKSVDRVTGKKAKGHEDDQNSSSPVTEQKTKGSGNNPKLANLASTPEVGAKPAETEPAEDPGSIQAREAHAAIRKGRDQRQRLESEEDSVVLAEEDKNAMSMPEQKGLTLQEMVKNSRKTAKLAAGDFETVSPVEPPPPYIPKPAKPPPPTAPPGKQTEALKSNPSDKDSGSMKAAQQAARERQQQEYSKTQTQAKPSILPTTTPEPAGKEGKHAQTPPLSNSLDKPEVQAEVTERKEDRTPLDAGSSKSSEQAARAKQQQEYNRSGNQGKLEDLATLNPKEDSKKGKIQQETLKVGNQAIPPENTTSRAGKEKGSSPDSDQVLEAEQSVNTKVSNPVRTTKSPSEKEAPQVSAGKDEQGATVLDVQGQGERLLATEKTVPPAHNAQWAWPDEVTEGNPKMSPSKPQDANSKQSVSKEVPKLNKSKQPQEPEETGDESDLEQGKGRRFHNAAAGQQSRQMQRKKAPGHIGKVQPADTQPISAQHKPYKPLSCLGTGLRAVKRAPVLSLCFLASIAAVAEGTRQIASLAFIMSRSSSIVKRGEIPADISKFHAFMLDKIKSPSTGSGSVMMLLHLWLFICIFLLLLMYVTVLQMAESVKELPGLPDGPKNATTEQSSSSRLASTWAGLKHALNICCSSVLMGAELHGPAYLWRQRSVRGMVKMMAVAMLVAGIGLMGYLVVSLALASSNASTSTLQGASSGSALSMLKDKYLLQAASRLTPTAAFGLVQLFMALAIPAIAYGLYTLLSPSSDTSAHHHNTHTSLNWATLLKLPLKAKKNMPLWLWDLIIISLLLTPYIGALLASRQLLHDSMVQAGQMSGAVALLLANMLLATFTLPFIMAVMRALEMVDRIRGDSK